MHMVIRVIVEADTSAEALDSARHTFGEMCQEGSGFDYFTMFDEPGSSVSGRSRWGDINPVMCANSEEGQQYINEGWEATKRELGRCLDKARHGLQHLTNEQIFEGADLSQDESIPPLIEKGTRYDGTPYESEERRHLEADWLMHYLRWAGGGMITNFFLWDHYGQPIRSKKELTKALELEEEGNKMWVVPADVHY